MTREEIIEGLKLLEDNMVYFDELLNDKGEYIDVHELLFESIEALKQEPCEDCISRKEVIQIINDFGYKNEHEETLINERIKDLPSVQPIMPTIVITEHEPYMRGTENE